jgi:HlyD family secretion protein
MKTWKKALIGVGVLVVVGVIVWVSVYQANKGVVTVQTGKVLRADLTSIVTASGEIRPKTYTNVLGQGMGKITEILVKEGDHVKKGQVLLRVEDIQPAADFDAQRAGMDSTVAGVKSAEANFLSAQATLQQRQADLEKAKFDWERGQELLKAQLIAKQEYDARKATYDSAVAAVAAAQAQLQQTRAAREQAGSNLDQTRAMVVHARDVLQKTTYTAPIDGLVTYIAVHVGENVIPGVLNSTAGSYLIAISDMSVVTAEVKVDETDINNVQDNQLADVTIDAMPGKTFKGHVTEVGDQAILRSSGLATTQTTATTQEARDFKVVVTLDDPPADIRPGLSTTAKIQTAERKNALTIPIQALAMRSRRELQDAESQGKKGNGSVTLAASKTQTSGDHSKEEVQGVFVIRANKAVFVPVQTGITGVTDIEVTNGLREGDEIVTGSYKALRTLRPNTTVKVDNTAPKQEEQTTT